MALKKFSFAAASASLLAITLVACGSVSTSTEESASGSTDDTTVGGWEAPEGISGELTYYSANPQGLTDALVEAFEEKTDVDVNVYADTTGKITARLKAEEANPQADVVYLASWDAASSQAASGALASYLPEGSENVYQGWSADNFVGRDGSAWLRPVAWCICSCR